MRSQHFWAPSLAVMGLVLATTACSSSSSPAASPSSSMTPPAAASTPASAPAAPSSPAAAAGPTQLITVNWEAFFSGKTDATQKIALLQNGQTFAAVIKAQAGSSLAQSATAVVTAVVVESASTATVSYNVDLNGTAALSNQTGTAVYQDGVWKVGDVSFCAILTLENAGKAPSVCAAG